MTAAPKRRARLRGGGRAFLAAFLLVLDPGAVSAQALVLPDPAQLAQIEPRPLAPGDVLPPLPPPPQQEADVPPRVRVFVRRVNVVGVTVVPAEEVARVTRRYEDRYLTADDLEALRVELTLLYVNRGYVNSGAILPDQTVQDGVVTYQVIEGTLTDIAIRQNRWFRSGYLRRRLQLGAGPPLNVNELQRQIQLLLEDPRIRRLSADLRPGLRPGESTLEVLVEEERPYRLVLDINNHQAPSVGAERGIVSLEHLNLTGNGDVLTLRYGRSDGLDPLLDFRYAVPVTARDTSVSFQYQRNAFAVIEEPFAELDIESESEIFTLGVRQPLYRTLDTQVAAELIGERLEHRTTLLGRRFSLLPGADDGETVVTALRGVLEWVSRSPVQVLAARSRVSVGIDALGATRNVGGDVPDGQFFAWLGQFQWVRRLPWLGSQLILRTDLQLTPDPLLTLEQVAVGGRYTVRGYRENTLIRDNAVLASLEVRVPVVRNKPGADYLELAPFYDYGRAWATTGTTPDPPDISSVGLGLRWGFTLPWLVSLRSHLEVYGGYRLRHVAVSDPDPLQDALVSKGRRGKKGRAGVHFQLVFQFY